jgi:hypothetical protein
MARRHLSLFINGQGHSVLHRSGFSWLAFVGLPLWAVHRRLWWCLPLTLLLPYGLHEAANALLDGLPSPDAQGLLAIVWLLGESWFMGHWADRMHLMWLRWRGYALTATEIPPERWPRHAPFNVVRERD